MSIVFRYANIKRPDGSLRKAPFIPIKLRNSIGKYVKVIALIDSGADTTVVPKDIANMITMKAGSEIIETSGIGGKTNVRKSKINLNISGEHETHNIKVPCLILEDASLNVPLLLGRNGFFEEFHITFKQDNEKIIIKKTSALSY